MDGIVIRRSDDTVWMGMEFFVELEGGSADSFALWGDRILL